MMHCFMCFCHDYHKPLPRAITTGITTSHYHGHYHKYGTPRRTEVLFKEGMTLIREGMRIFEVGTTPFWAWVGEGKPLFGEGKCFFGEGKCFFGEGKCFFGEGKRFFGEDNPFFGEDEPVRGGIAQISDTMVRAENQQTFREHGLSGIRAECMHMSLDLLIARAPSNALKEL